jgi:hypothetical protein
MPKDDGLVADVQSRERHPAQLESAFQRTECCPFTSKTSRRYRIESSEPHPSRCYSRGLLLLHCMNRALDPTAHLGCESSYC